MRSLYQEVEVEADGIEETVMEVAVAAAAAAGVEKAGEREVLCPPTTAGRTSLRTATMEAAVVAGEVETIGEVVEAVAEVSGTAMTGPNLCQGTRGWRRNSSTPPMARLASTLTGEI